MLPACHAEADDIIVFLGDVGRSGENAGSQGSVN